MTTIMYFFSLQSFERIVAINKKIYILMTYNYNLIRLNPVFNNNYYIIPFFFLSQNYFIFERERFIKDFLSNMIKKNDIY